MAKQPEFEEEEMFVVRPAVRHAVPQTIGVYGVQFSGKTYGAFMLAAGLVEPGGKIGFIDTENQRGSVFADDPDVCAAIPRDCWVDGSPYCIVDIYPPFHPRRYIGACRELERQGCTVIITDSGSHAWSEEGGALDMKEKDKSWVNAKLWTKRFTAAIRYSPAHHIVCLRAQEKNKVVGTGKEQKYIPLGILPICDRAFLFDLGLSISVEGEIDGKPATHLARPFKWPKAMNGLFNDWTPQLLTPEVGRRIREWNNSAPAEDVLERLKVQARGVAEEGMVAYQKFFGGLTKEQRKMLSEVHSENKAIADKADREQLEPEHYPDFASAPDPMQLADGAQIRIGGKLYAPNADRSSFTEVTNAA